MKSGSTFVAKSKRRTRSLLLLSFLAGLAVGMVMMFTMMTFLLSEAVIPNFEDLVAPRLQQSKETSLRKPINSRIASAAAAIIPTTKTTTRRNKFIKYGTTSGWSNQIISLEHAYWLAAATNRTLVMAPIMSHFETIQWTYMEQTVDQVYQSKLDTNPLMTSVLNFSTSSVNVLDYQDYYQQKILNYPKRKLTEIQLTLEPANKKKQPPSHTQYRCDNTIFTFDKTKHSKQTTNDCYAHVGMIRKGTQSPYENVMYKHPQQELLQQYDEYDVWTFNFLYPESLFDRASFERHPPNQLPFHYVQPIRQAARKIYKSWNIGRRYYSLHYRGSDGPYQKTSNWADIMSTTLESAKRAILQHAAQKQSATTTSRSTIEYVILLVTDIKELIQLKEGEDSGKKLVKLWKEHSQRLTDELRKDAPSISLRFVTPGSYQKESDALTALLHNEHAPIFLDQQLAACADLGFSGSHLPESSFQRRIQQLHQQAEVDC